MVNKKMAVVLAAAISLAIVSAGCGIDENLNVNPSVTARIQESTEEPKVTDEVVTTAEKQIITDADKKETEVSELVTVPTEVSEVTTEIKQESVTQVQAQVQNSVEQPSVQQPDKNTSSGEEVEPTYINGILIANKTYALPQAYAPGDLTTATQEAFAQLKSAAAEQGLSIWNQSGYRSYETQQRLYNNYVQRDGKDQADTYSARPGHSEHQTGLALDLNTIDMSFEQTAEFTWVSQNCYKYGFIIRYPKGKESITGYQYEPWHLRYLGVETATDVYNSGLCLEEYLGITSTYAD